MIVIIDNYDSFTYNLVQRLGEIDPSLDLEVHRNDKITLDEIEAIGRAYLAYSREQPHYFDACSRFEARPAGDGVQHE